MRAHWQLEPGLRFLNHGSYGAAPRVVLEAQRRFRDQLEAEPVRFMDRELEPLWDAARERLSGVVGADPADLVFVPNATTGVNTVLRSLRLSPGDELLTTDHAYNACRNALDEVAERASATVRTVTLPWPSPTEDAVVAAVVAGFGPRTKLLLLDHVTSPTALVLPVERILREARAHGVPVLVDGAHAPGMVPLSLSTLGADYYTGNCHKWMCAPKGVAFLWVRPDLQPAMRPLVVSHGKNARRTDRSRFLLEFDWSGTADPSGVLALPTALDFLEGLVPGGLPALMAENHALAVRARSLLSKALGTAPLAPESMLGSMAVVPLPDAAVLPDGLHDTLLRDHRIEVPIFPFPTPSHRLLRVSAQRYNSWDEYEALAHVLPSLLSARG